MPLPLSNLVQRRRLSVSKRVRSLPVAPSPLDGRSDSPEVCPVSLFDQLPVEMQIEIFTHCLPPLPCFDPREAPLLLASVSQAWRAIVLAVPSLWSSFGVSVSTSRYDLYLERSVALWLARSKNHPLTVSISHLSFGQVLCDLSARLLALLIPEAPRWRSVQFDLPTANMMSLPSHLPLLESFGLHLIGSWTSAPTVNLSTTSIPWRQLSRLNLQLEPNNLPTLGNTLWILSQTPRLRVFNISVECTLDRGDLDDLHLPVLEEFHLMLQGGNVFPLSSNDPVLSLTKFLHHISMPTLRALSISWLAQIPDFWTNRDVFVSFLRRVSPTLKSLNLAYLPVSEAELVELLVLFSNVTHLVLRFSLNDEERDPISDNLFRLLSLRNTLSDGSHPLLPSLMSLDVECTGSRFSISNVLTMVESRWKKGAGPGHGFIHFRLFSRKAQPREAEKQMEEMRRQGLDITFASL